jgi:hypothetical protein
LFVYLIAGLIIKNVVLEKFEAVISPKSLSQARSGEDPRGLTITI